MNRSYNKNADLSRADTLIKVLPKIMFSGLWLKGKTYFGLGATMLTFLHEIPPLSRYNIYTRFVAWDPDDKWFYCQTIFTISDKRGKIRPENISSIVPEDEAVCAVMYCRYCWKLKSGKTIRVTQVLKDEGYIVSEDMLRLNERNWQIVKEFHEMMEKEKIVQSLRKFSRL